MRRGFALAVVGLVLLTGCGEDDSISDAATARLTPEVAAVRAAAEAGDRAAAEATLDRLRDMVAALTASGEISKGRAAGVLDAAGDLEAQLVLVPATTTTTAPPPVVVEDREGDDDGGDRGDGKKGKGDKDD